MARAGMRGNAVRVGLFVIVTLVLGALITVTLGRYDFGAHADYSADFRDVSGLKTGADVRAAGVAVGRVGAMTLLPDDSVKVTFSVARDVPLSSTTQARVRYANLAGDRYLELTSRPGTGTALAPGSTIPLSRTRPALDLDLLFDGFRPLMAALNPQQVNELTASLIGVSQGEAPQVDALLTHVASFTQAVGARQQLIQSVIGNLDSSVGAVDAHRADLGHLVDGLQRLMRGLAQDRQTVGEGVAQADRLAATAASYLSAVRPGLAGTLAQGLRMATQIADNFAFADHYLKLMPAAVKAVGRDGAYGSFFNFYMCGARFHYTGPDGKAHYTSWQLSKEPRCQF